MGTGLALVWRGWLTRLQYWLIGWRPMKVKCKSRPMGSASVVHSDCGGVDASWWRMWFNVVTLRSSLNFGCSFYTLRPDLTCCKVEAEHEGRPLKYWMDALRSISHKCLTAITPPPHLLPRPSSPQHTAVLSSAVHRKNRRVKYGKKFRPSSRRLTSFFFWAVIPREPQLPRGRVEILPVLKSSVRHWF